MSTSDPLFQNTLQDLVKGIRINKKDPSSYISQSIAQIKSELKSNDPYIKSEGIRKLTYLQMIGYNIDWAAFSIVEVMSLSKFAHKRIGYLAANQSFTETTDVILLTTNLFKKELAASTASQYEIGLALNSLANIATKDLAHDCITDVVNLMNHTKPYVRKKAVLALYKLYVKFPQGLRLTFDKLKDRLDDTESSVVSCAVNVICELANKNPKNYLAMAPKFFRLLTTSSNNWMLIKVVKLMGSLVSEEPRLARKLLDPLTTIIQNTGAKSLQYECIHTITEALPHTKREDGTDAKNVPLVVKLCSDYLRGFIEENDQNLKYLGLVGLVNLLKSHPRNVIDHREIILKCLNDDDNTIRVRALELLAGIVSKKSLVDLVLHLLEHAKRAEGKYRDDIISKVLYMCSKDKFGLVTDFAWYISVLLDLAVMQGSKHGKEVADQMIDVALRVDTVRPFAVESMLSLLLNEKLILGQARQTVSEVLKAAAWIVGEYSYIVSNIANDTADDDEVEENENLGYWIEGPSGEDIRSLWRGQELHVQVIDALLNPRATNLPAPVQCTYIQAAMKVFVRACVDREEAEIASIIGTLRSRLTTYLQSQHNEVQERASTLRHILAEFGILSMNWEASVTPKNAKKNNFNIQSNVSTSDTSSFLLDLLDVPEITSAIAKPVDDDGARQAKLKSKVLLAAIAEPFYAVHSKAQRKVPVPEGLVLNKPIKESALNKLLQVEIPDNLNMSTLFFIQEHNYNSNESASGYNYNSSKEKEPIAMQGISSSSVIYEGNAAFSASAADTVLRNSSSYTSFFGELTKSNPTNPTPNTTAASSSNKKSTGDNLFYLSASNNSSNKDHTAILPLSQMLADSFEDTKKSKKKNKKDKKISASAQQHAPEIDKREMLPAGALSSDDDFSSKKRANVKSNDVPITRRKNKDDVDLEHIDLSTPLRDDEVLIQPKHREVPITQKLQSTSNTVIDEDHHDSKKKKEKKNKDDKKSKKTAENIDILSGSVETAHVLDQIPSIDKTSKKKKSKDDKKSTSKVGEDLLSFDWSSSASSVIANNSVNLNTVSASSIVLDTKATKDKKPSSSSHLVWIPLFSDLTIEVLYSANPAVGKTNTVSVSIRVLISKQLMSVTGQPNVSVDVFFNDLPSTMHFTTTNLLALGMNLLPNEEAVNQLELTYDTAFIDTTVLAVTIRSSFSTISQPKLSNAKLTLFANSCLIPNKVDEQSFASILSKSSSKWANLSTRIQFTGKAKSAMKSIAKYLKCAIIEEEYTRAVSLCSKLHNTSGSSGTVCCLAKWGKDSTVISVDIKVLAASKPDSVAVAESLVLALNELKL